MSQSRPGSEISLDDFEYVGTYIVDPDLHLQRWTNTLTWKSFSKRSLIRLSSLDPQVQ